jgi:hypothetical protein
MWSTDRPVAVSSGVQQTLTAIQYVAPRTKPTSAAEYRVALLGPSSLHATKVRLFRGPRNTARTVS